MWDAAGSAAQQAGFSISAALGYWCESDYGRGVDFALEQLSHEQKAAFRELLERVLTDDEKQHGNAGWHFVCPPKK